MTTLLNRWKGKIAIVTGASAGIGASLVEKLSEEGLEVVGFARRVERVDELAKKFRGNKGKIHGLKVDMTNEDDIIKGFKWVSDNVGPVSILINNAGLAQKGTLIDGDTSKWQTVINTNVIGLSIATREAIKIMRENKIDGHIIHVNSVAGHKVPNFPGMNIYPASKHAVTALTETLRQELNHIGSKIKITSVSPGGVETEFVEAANFGTVESIKERFPLLKSEDISDAVLYVLSTPPHVQVHELIIKPIGESI